MLRMFGAFVVAYEIGVAAAAADVAAAASHRSCSALRAELVSVVGVGSAGRAPCMPEFVVVSPEFYPEQLRHLQHLYRFQNKTAAFLFRVPPHIPCQPQSG